jgi:tRNA (guanine37-N1)-methyltransferase
MKPKITFEVITLFPDIIESYLKESIIGRAIKGGLIEVRIHDLRNFTVGPHHKADDRPYGGGPGMVMKPEPLIKAIDGLRLGKSKSRTKMVMLSAAGKKFDDTMARSLAAKYSRIVLIAGHYEGIDGRVSRIFKPEEVSVGPYVLTGGELPALTIIDAVSRKVKDVLGKEGSLEEKRYGVGVPAYTRPSELKYKGKKYIVPKVLLSGDHKAIEGWRLEHKRK